MGWDNNIDTWKLNGYASETDCEEDNHDSSFYSMMRQMMLSDNSDHLDIIEMAKASVKIDCAKKVN